MIERPTITAHSTCAAFTEPDRWWLAVPVASSRGEVVASIGIEVASLTRLRLRYQLTRNGQTEEHPVCLPALPAPQLPQPTGQQARPAMRPFVGSAPRLGLQ